MEAWVSVDALSELVRGKRLAVLVGAGCSTESGIPDYRGPETARRARNPIQYKGFVGDAEARRRYWARSVIGWPRVRDARPNPGHFALAELERRGALVGLITQNVDGLHHAAGSERIVELHGALRQVRCLDCEVISSRQRLQDRLLDANPGWGQQGAGTETAPDGDAELEPDAGFVVLGCEGCGGELKPHVVFFGEGVPRERVDRAYAWVDEADALLVVGSSLQVFSGYRFVKRAEKRQIPVAIVNLGPTRGDPLATLRVEGKAGTVLPRLVAAR